MDNNTTETKPTFGELRDTAEKLSAYYEEARGFFRDLDELEDLLSCANKEAEEAEYEKELKRDIASGFSKMGEIMKSLPEDAARKVQSALIAQTMQMFNMTLEMLKNA